MVYRKNKNKTRNLNFKSASLMISWFQNITLTRAGRTGGARGGGLGPTMFPNSNTGPHTGHPIFSRSINDSPSNKMHLLPTLLTTCKYSFLFIWVFLSCSLSNIFHKNEWLMITVMIVSFVLFFWITWFCLKKNINVFKLPSLKAFNRGSSFYEEGGLKRENTYVTYQGVMDLLTDAYMGEVYVKKYRNHAYQSKSLP